MCGITFFAKSLSTNPNLFNDNIPLSLSLATENKLGSNVLLDDDAFSSLHLIGGGNYAWSSVVGFVLNCWPLDQGWLSSSGDLIEDGTSLGKTLTFDENSESDLYDQTFEGDDIAANQCVSSPSPWRKLRNREDPCEKIFNPGPKVKLPDLEYISLESKRNKYCGRSQWATFGNVPVCVIWPHDINSMTSAVLGKDGPLALPLMGVCFWLFM